MTNETREPAVGDVFEEKHGKGGFNRRVKVLIVACHRGTWKASVECLDNYRRTTISFETLATRYRRIES